MSHASPAPRSVEEHAYLDKLQKLSRYVEPLKRMINKMTSDNKEGMGSSIQLSIKHCTVSPETTYSVH